MSEKGNDLLVDGPTREFATDRLTAGGGNDVVAVFNALAFKDLVTCGGGFDWVFADGKDMVADDCERVADRVSEFLRPGLRRRGRRPDEAAKRTAGRGPAREEVPASLSRSTFRWRGRRRPGQSSRPRLDGARTGEPMRIPPTGHNISVRGTSVLTIENGKVTRGLYLWDVAGLLRSIGLLPEL